MKCPLNLHTGRQSWKLVSVEMCEMRWILEMGITELTVGWSHSIVHGLTTSLGKLQNLADVLLRLQRLNGQTLSSAPSNTLFMPASVAPRSVTQTVFRQPIYQYIIKVSYKHVLMPLNQHPPISKTQIYLLHLTDSDLKPTRIQYASNKLVSTQWTL